MSAGTGVRHSEYNASAIDTVGFLQIWIIPDREGYEPRYAQKDFSASTGITLVVSPDGRDDSLTIRQQASIYQLKLADEVEHFSTDAQRVYYLQIACGSMSVNGQILESGDGAAIWDEDELRFEAKGAVNALLMDLRRN